MTLDFSEFKLAELQLAHLTSVPFETSPLHVSEDDDLDEDAPILLSGGKGFDIDVRVSFENVVRRRRGG
jgi:hypothetical protein